MGHPWPQIEVFLDFARPREAPGSFRRPPEASRGLPEASRGLPGPPWALKNPERPRFGAKGKNALCLPVEKLEIKNKKRPQTPRPPPLVPPGHQQKAKQS